MPSKLEENRRKRRGPPIFLIDKKNIMNYAYEKIVLQKRFARKFFS